MLLRVSAVMLVLAGSVCAEELTDLWLIYSRCDRNHDCDIVKKRPASPESETIEVVARPGISEHSPTVSPDGATLAFVTEEYTPSRNLNIWTKSLPDGVPSALYSSPGHDRDPSWSPDGSMIAIGSGITDSWTEVVIISDGGAVIDTMTRNNTIDGSPAWGNGVLYFTSSRISHTNTELYTIDPTMPEVFGDPSTEATRLYTGTTGNDNGVDVGPDGRIAFFTRRSASDEDILVANGDASGTVPISDSSYLDYEPSWSPDGRFIAFHTYRFRDNGWGADIVVYDTDTDSLHQITDSADTNDIGVDWLVLPNSPPDVGGALPSVGTVWPPNHKMVSITVLGVSDPDGDEITITITSITDDEGAEPGDAAGVGTDTAQIRAERDGGGDGRVYTIAFQATDGTATSDGIVTISVPHDRGKKKGRGKAVGAHMTWGEIKRDVPE